MLSIAKSGLISSGISGLISSEYSLCYKCNDFISCTYDIAALKHETGSAGTNTGIAASQGQKNPPTGTPDPKLPAGNTFSTNSGHLSDLYNNARPFNYIHHNTNTPLKKVIPTLYSSTTITLLRDTRVNYTKESSCPSILDNGGGDSAEESKALAEAADAEADSLNNVLTELLDGGNTEALNNEVALSTPPEALATRDALLAESPYLTDTVMKTTIAKEDVLPNAMVRDVLVANPQSAKEPQLLEALDTRLDPMPEEMLAEIMQNASIIGAKEQIEDNISQWNLLKSNSIYNVIKAYEADTLKTWAVDSLFAFLGRQNTPESRYDLAIRYALKGQTTNADIQLYLAGQMAGSTPKAISLHNQWCQLIEIVSALRGNGFVPDSIQTISLQNLSNEGTAVPSIYARNFLLSTAMLDNTEEICLPEHEGLKIARAYKFRGVSLSKQTHCLSIYPNPSNNFLIVSYKIDKGINAMIMVIENSGKLVHKQSIRPISDQIVLPLSNYNAGNYQITLIVDDIILQTLSFTKTR